MQLHWSPRSPFVRKVDILIHERGLDARIERIRSPVSMLAPNPDLMALNPWNKIPTLVTDEGLALFDSDVICEYLDGLGDEPRLIPPPGPARWKALRWSAFAGAMLDALVLWRNEQARPEPLRLQRLMEVFDLKVRAGLRALEHEAAELAAAPFGIGQIALGCALSYLDFRFSAFQWRRGHDRLAAWHAELDRRPSFVKTAPIDEHP